MTRPGIEPRSPGPLCVFFSGMEMPFIRKRKKIAWTVKSEILVVPSHFVEIWDDLNKNWTSFLIANYIDSLETRYISNNINSFKTPIYIYIYICSKYKAGDKYCNLCMEEKLARASYIVGKWSKRNKQNIKNVCLFVVERFRLLNQMKSIRLFYDFFSWILFYKNKNKVLKHFHDFCV